MNILIMGPAGAGKGTMSEKILQDYDIAHISTGDMLRENVRQQTEQGKLAQSYMEKGLLVPDEVLNAMVEVRLQQPDCANGYLLDGYPRTLNQAKAFDEITQKIGKPAQVVIALDIDFELVKERITGRRICPSCGAIYHVKNHPSKQEGICDVCGSALEQRKDDTVERLEVRNREYQENTAPVIGYYDELHKTVHVDAADDADKVYAAIRQALQQIQ